MRSARGLTLLEVLIAIFILGVAVLAALTLQHTAFRATTKARVAKAAAAIIRDRIERMRAQPSDLSDLCTSNEEINGFTMNCVKTPCSLTDNSGATNITCASGENADLYKIEITLSNNVGNSFKVTTYVKGE